VSTNETIRDFICSHLLQGGNNRILRDEDRLIESGILDSMAIMALLQFLEREFDLQVPGEDLVPDNFASIATIATFVDRHVARQ
jgi:acyl carrier protein